MKTSTSSSYGLPREMEEPPGHRAGPLERDIVDAVDPSRMLPPEETEEEEEEMYGTVARMKVKRENLDALKAEFNSEDYPAVPGFRASHVLIPDKWNDEVTVAVFFDDRASYVKNAGDPAMHERYVAYRALLEADPEWTDGEWVTTR